jgi:hypothetical protein
MQSLASGSPNSGFFNHSFFDFFTTSLPFDRLFVVCTGWALRKAPPTLQLISLAGSLLIQTDSELYARISESGIIPSQKYAHVGLFVKSYNFYWPILNVWSLITQEVPSKRVCWKKNGNKDMTGGKRKTKT